eukprot:Tamp_30043.p1 GENE.Tamp_30043~~Tamp_30043.p1  ORF type:complete len:184 (+),score=44.44 Tamp_30043:101-652(+)
MRARARELEEAVRALAMSMAKGYDDLGFLLFKCRFCNEEMSGASSAFSIQRHLIGRHKNYLYSNDLAAEAEKEAHERVAAREEEAYLREQAKATLKQMQIDRMHLRQKEADAYKAGLREEARISEVQQTAKRRELRRDVIQMRQLKRGAMRFHPKWGYVPNDVEPLRFGNKLNRKRRRKFLTR